MTMLSIRFISLQAMPIGLLMRDSKCLTSDVFLSNLIRGSGEAQGVVDLITFLASDKAEFITSATIPVDEGYTSI